MSKPGFRALSLFVLLALTIVVFIISSPVTPPITGNGRSSESLATVPIDPATDAPSKTPDADTMIGSIPPSQLTGSVFEISSSSTLTNRAAPSDEQTHTGREA